MRVRRAVVKVLAAAVVTLAAPATSIAADITVLCSTPLRHIMAALIPQFERATNHRVLITYGASPELKQKSSPKRNLISSCSHPDFLTV
jgi:ABC-type molybdate transport system substrate-binding protein